MEKNRRSKTPGLVWRHGIWHIDKRIRGYGRLCESCRTSDLAQAEEYLTARLAEIHRQTVLGARPARTWAEAATRYLNETKKRSLSDDAQCLLALAPYIQKLQLEQVHDGTLAPFKEAMIAKGWRAKTINLHLGVVRRILNLAARSWRDDRTGQTWLAQAPLITMLGRHAHLDDDRIKAPRRTYPLTWDEQTAFVAALPHHLVDPVLFAIHTGCRDQEVVGLQWAWLHANDEVGLHYMLLPGTHTKSKRDEVVVLNAIAYAAVERQRGRHDKYVFTWRRGAKRGARWKRLTTLRSHAWRRAWVDAGLPTGEHVSKGPHNLRHTFATRLRAVGVGLETRSLLLRHASENLTTHYSTPQWLELANAVARIEHPAGGVPQPLLRAINGTEKPAEATPQDESITQNSRKGVSNGGK